MINGILLDIEGTTSSISFVHDVMFPFVSQHLAGFLRDNFQLADVAAACNQIAKDKGYESLDAWQTSQGGAQPIDLVVSEVRELMASDIKATGLKALQGLIWEGGFHSGQLRAHVYPDVLPAIRAWRDRGIEVRIYSSGSVAAQKLFFGHLESHGNCLDLFSGHYDTTIGGKQESSSYSGIIQNWGLAAGTILFISDVPEELLAAQEAGMQVLASVRPGNKPMPHDLPLHQIDSFAQVDVGG